VDILATPFRNPVEYFLHCLETDTPVSGPLSPEMSRVGQQIVDTARLSAQQRRALPLLEGTEESDDDRAPKAAG
jgi:glucose-fructose oxidoreductase